jgi:hypothetical protein
LLVTESLLQLASLALGIVAVGFGLAIVVPRGRRDDRER